MTYDIIESRTLDRPACETCQNHAPLFDRPLGALETGRLMGARMRSQRRVGVDWGQGSWVSRDRMTGDQEFWYVDLYAHHLRVARYGDHDSRCSISFMEDKARMLVLTYEVTRPSSPSSWADTGDANAMLLSTMFDLQGYGLERKQRA
jgi:hypothetical protein